MSRPFSSVPAAVDAIARGEVVIVVDDEDRENEGDFICAAEKATAENINFILDGRGQLCAPILPEVCRRLELTPIVEANNAPLRTAFMTPIDHRSGEDRHHGRGAGTGGPHAGRSDCQDGRLCSAGTSLSVAGQGRRRLAACGTYRGDGRPVPDGGTRAGGRVERDPGRAG